MRRLILILGLGLTACATVPQASVAFQNQVQRTLVGPPIRPNLELTPGLVRDIPTQTVCTIKWGLDRRMVTIGMKKRVAAAYGVSWEDRRLYEFDHLVPRSLGGADHELNLWPQAWAGQHGARKKDRLEVKLGKLVCNGTVTLAFAQETIRTDWIAAYRLYITEPPAAADVY